MSRNARKSLKRRSPPASRRPLPEHPLPPQARLRLPPVWVPPLGLLWSLAAHWWRLTGRIQSSRVFGRLPPTNKLIRSHRLGSRRQHVKEDCEYS